MRRSNAVYFGLGLVYGTGFWYDTVRRSNVSERRFRIDMSSEKVTGGDRLAYSAGATIPIALQMLALGFALGYSTQLLSR